MSIIGLILILAFLGVLAWVTNYKLPISPGFKMIIHVVLFIIAVLICLSAFGILDQVKDAKVPRL